MPLACYRQQQDSSEKDFPIRLPHYRLMSENRFETEQGCFLKAGIFYALALARVTTITRYLISMNRQNVIDPHIVKAH